VPNFCPAKCDTRHTRWTGAYSARIALFATRTCDRKSDRNADSDVSLSGWARTSDSADTVRCRPRAAIALDRSLDGFFLAEFASFATT